MFYAAALPIGHLVTALTPASKQESLDALATKIEVSTEHLKSFVPQIQASYLGDDGKGPTNISNINKGSDAPG
jgi:hypothetical protein